MKYQLEIKPGAEGDLNYYSSHVRQIIAEAISDHLQNDAGIQTKKKKKLRENPVAPWELKIGDYRVFYEIVRETVNVLAVGHKKHNNLFIRGKKVKI
ncbi:MAG: hypothetical protein BWK80_57415 [Desulfobacteraceae bacterium IS3]|nr:MAG: hypothetical protein BWK80_57415 [Desulfobacteraceae bacterium IS3]